MLKTPLSLVAAVTIHQFNRWTALSASALVLVVVPAALAQDNQNENRGFDAESVYSGSEIDTVNIFSGGLSMVIPIGDSYPLSTRISYGFKLIYNSKLWDYRSEFVPPGGSTRISVPTRITNSGLGWTFNPGFFLEENGSSDIPYEGNHSQYVAPDGSRHYFEDTLHEGETENTDVWYSRDNTYLRLKKLTSPTRYQIEFPRGETHEFAELEVLPEGNWQKWYLTKIEDRYGNSMSISYGSKVVGQPWVWTITDVHGRSHTVTFAWYADIEDHYLETVDLQAFGGARAVYSFTYVPDMIQQACAAEQPMNNVDVRFLTRITIPGGQSYEMLDDSVPPEPRYRTFCGGLGESGAIEGIRLPTRGQIEWQFAEFQLPHYFDPPFNPASGDVASVDVFAVRQRRTLDEDGNVIGRWDYFRELEPAIPTVPGQDPSKEQRVHVKDPLGHCTTHYFDANTGNWDQGPNPDPGWSYGLPFSWDELQSGGKYLSTQVYDAIDGTVCGGAVGTLLRSTYVDFVHDELPFLSPTQVGPLLELWHNTDRRLESTRTVYNDDGDRFAETTSDDFDGVGHYRDTTTGGDFGAGNVRQMVTDFNPSLGTYEPDGTGDFTDPPFPSEPWVLETFERLTAIEGGETAIATSCFDADGFLTRRRTLVGATEGANDLISEFTPDAGGNVAFERYYGGDLQTLEPPHIELCTYALPATPEYEMEHQYAFGTRKLSRYLGLTPSFNTVDRDIDPSTGLVAASRDTAGIETDLVYDELGRLTDEQPEAGHGALVKYTYVDATSTNKARVEIERGASLAEMQIVFDGLGRVFQEKSELPSGAFGVRETTYSDRGDRASVSEVELGTPVNKTEYLEHDPFGRPGRIRPADGASHDITIAYLGVRRVARTSQVATGAGGVENPSTFVEIYDRQGRLFRLVEPETGALTTYGYDVGNRLSSVAMSNGSVTQTRLFVYDHLGFLRSEQHPETGSIGNGTVTYSNYDARGNIGRLVDQLPRTLDYTYDAAERLLTVSEVVAGPIKSFVYDTATTHGAGKLHRAVRHNRRDIPGDGTSNFIDVVVTETYEYNAVGGRVSSVLTTNNFNTLEFLTSQTYNDLGRVEDIVYPICQVAAECPSDPLTVHNSYLANYLTDVGTPGGPGAFASIAYHPNGLWSLVSHGNTVTTTQVNDPNAMRRPRQIFVSGTDMGAPPLDTGIYSYDGSGNVWSMGSDEFEYDSLSRVTDAAVHGWDQDFLYDDFGNVTRIRTTEPGQGQSTLSITVTPGTNRLTNSTYDGSGNMTIFNNVDPAWTQDYDLMNMASARNPDDDASQWVAIYTASDERLATWDLSSGELEQHWTLRSPSGQVLRDFRFGPANPGDLIFADGFESGDTSAWSAVVPFAGGRTQDLAPPKTPFGASLWSVKTSYIYRGGSLLADYVGGDIRHYHLDHLGSVRQITNGDTDVAESRDFLPYGREVSSSQGALQFTGHERDSHLAGDVDNLDYMHARYYTPHAGRFVSVDPATRRGASKTPQQWNRYSYAHNNPLLKVDLDGRDAIAVVFPDYRVRAGTFRGRPIRLPFGHAGVISINPRGRTRYYEFGRYGSAVGRVRNRRVPDVEIGSNGLPTQASLGRLLRAVSTISGGGGAVEASYFADVDASDVNEFAEGQIRNGRAPYDLFGNNCATFCEDAIEAGGVEIPGFSVGPRGLSDDAQNQAEFVLFLESANAQARADCGGQGFCPEDGR